MSRQGEAAAQKHNLHRYIDGSCRREPDLEAAYPALSALCRGGIFVPKLKEGDVVVYLTKKGRYENLPPHRRLVASVTIYKKFASHQDAAAWYNAQNAELPQNCLVENNAPVAWEKTHQKPILPDGEPKTLENWDSKYQARAALHPAFCAAKAAFLELHNPPYLSDADMVSIFTDYGRIPITQNPPVISQGDYDRLLQFARK